MKARCDKIWNFAKPLTDNVEDVFSALLLIAGHSFLSIYNKFIFDQINLSNRVRANTSVCLCNFIFKLFAFALISVSVETSIRIGMSQVEINNSFNIMWQHYVGTRNPENSVLYGCNFVFTKQTFCGVVLTICNYWIFTDTQNILTVVAGQLTTYIWRFFPHKLLCNASDWSV